MKKIILLLATIYACISYSQTTLIYARMVNHPCKDTVNVYDTLIIELSFNKYKASPVQYVRLRTSERKTSWVDYSTLRGVGKDSSKFFYKWVILPEESFPLYAQMIQDTNRFNAQQQDVRCSDPSLAFKLYINRPVAVVDNQLDKTKTIAYYLDLNGRQLSEPKGFVIVVYTDGSRGKILFE